MQEAVTKQHAHPNTVLHCLYGFYNLGYSRKELARVYHESETTIGNWIRVYEATGTFERARKASDKKFSSDHRAWLCDFYGKHPLAYLDEVQEAFVQAHHITISKSSIWRIIRDYGLTWKVLERRAMHIKERDIFRLVDELAHIDWSHHNLVFLDEVSFDNRGMIRKRGYSLKGQKLAIRGDFQRKPRVSILAFIGVRGLIDYFDTQGTFDRIEFVKCCRDFAYSKRGNVRRFPGSRSVWILDGASIHRYPEIIHFLRSIGIVPVSLPAYCPFFNPIEYMFGYVKKTFQHHYNESSGRDLIPFAVQTFHRFEGFNMSRVFEHCGWKIQGVFDPNGPMSTEKRQVPDIWGNEQELGNEENDLGFRERERERERERDATTTRTT
ncbi:hypothetical protein PC116_g18046 [Phytophthora cactorum]|uniref:Tc1-like transposase DDE domain-containing protein n=1 Tax=Phytophthora cactorum TaxID=29920 RepID=A0A8T1F4N3_9STRA|nr:hypothetical protein PC114_g15216 [Phytophthora cactorum]KAG2921956.1 hypothetical protein PC117_g16094 [Phytophthora cactorum]KAG2968190.1 hypothetical protein PC118_g18171 [Phytophthora cactorum]KAG2988153.1 hypothetical protein PC119_g19539 [Phytophthora cactorum]KAG3153547.1 hypothetical protein C6341_g15900 [Phytophthora cactorum]